MLDALIMKILADGEYPCDCGYETCETQLVVSRNGNLIGILDPNGVGFSVNFVLPDGIRLCWETPDGTPWELFGRIMLHLHNLGPLREGDADAFTTFIRQNRPEVKP